MNKLFISQRLIVYVSLAFCLGIIIGNFTKIPATGSLLALVGLFLVMALVYLKDNQGLGMIFLVTVVVWGAFWLAINEPAKGEINPWPKEKIEAVGKVHSISNKSTQFIVEIHQVNNQELSLKPKVLMIVPSYVKQTALQWGDQIKVTGQLAPMLPRTNPGGFSEKDYWRGQGVSYKLFASQEVKLLQKSTGISGAINNIREQIYLNISQTIPKEEGGLALGLILGDRSQIDSGLYERFQRLGVVHIFAVSGLHVGFLVMLYSWITSILRIPKKYTLLGAVLIFATYALLTGLTPSVIRASIMAFIAMVLVVKLKNKDFYSILATAGLVILFINPLSLFSVGFQLSFITTWGLVYLFPLAQRLVFFLSEKPRKILAVPIAAQLAALPIIIYYFNIFSFWAPLVNVLFVMVIAILVPLLFLSLLIAFISLTLAQPFLFLIGGIFFALSQVTIALADFLPLSHLYIATPPISAIIIYYLLLIGCIEIDWLKEKIAPRFKLAISLLVILLIFIMAVPNTRPLQYTFLDVGQGDGCVIQTPLEQFIVIDGGPYANTVASYLQYCGANKVDLVILSHSHLDHINGLFKVLEQFPVRALLVPPNVENCSMMEEFIDMAQEKNTLVIEGIPGMTIKVPGGIKLEIISPHPDHLPGLDANNGSLVVRQTYGERHALFTGDMENKIIRRIMPLFKPVDIFKVPHHGSRSSYHPEMYTRLDPKVAIIQAGRNNRYHHPHLEVTESLQDRGIALYRNDLQGAIIIETNGQTIKVKPYLKEPLNY